MRQSHVPVDPQTMGSQAGPPKSPSLAPPRCEAPSRWLTLIEGRALLEAFGLVGQASRLKEAPRGDGRAVMLVPGYLADRYSMAPLGAFLRFLGYRVLDWGLGRNRGDVEPDIERFRLKVRAASEALDGEALTLIGWSLGGVLCREAARLDPESVREVITFGTPIVGGPRYTFVAKAMVRLKKIDLPRLEQDIQRRNLMVFLSP